MHVEKLSLLNIRSYPSASLEFSKGINLIMGPNNSGKSTILRSLQNLQKGLMGTTVDDVRKTEELGKIHIQLSGIVGEEIELFYPKDGSVLVGKQQSILYSFWNDRRSGKKEEALQIGQALKTAIDNNDIKVTLESGEYVFDDSFAPFPLFPGMENENNFIYPFLAKRKTAHYSSQGGHQAAYGISEQMHNLPSRIQNLLNDTHPYSEEYKRHAKDILGFAPGKVPGGERGHEDKLGIFVRQQDNVYLESMGDGVANILGLLAILLTDNNKLFLIEELENDIHPEALKKLLSLIIDKSANNQFIITTHSNIVLKYLASVPEAKVFYTDWSLVSGTGRNKYKIPTSKISEVGNTPTERLDILLKLGYDFFDFDLYSSYILFEESSAEQLVREVLIPEFVPSLKDKVKTIAASGADNLLPRFNDFLRLFVFIHTSPLYKERAWVIADGDDAGKDAVKRLREKFPWPKEHFINLTKSNIEEYYPEQFKKEFESIKTERDRRLMFEKKKQLTAKVMDWIKRDPDEARDVLSNTCKELIDILISIGSQLLTKQK